MADLKTTNIYGDAYINNKVGINTNAPATRLQIGQLTPSTATEGIQFGDDLGTRIYRSGTGTLTISGSLSVVSNFSSNGSLTSTYGSFTTPGIIIGDAQYGFYVSDGNVYYKSASGGVHYWRNKANNANTLTLDDSGNLTVTNDLFVNNQLQVKNDNPTITLRDTNASSSFIHVNANIFHILGGPPNAAFGEWAIGVNGRWPMEINLTNNNATFGGSLDAISFTGSGSGLFGTAANLTAGTATSANALNASNNYQVNSIGIGMAGSGTAGKLSLNQAGVRSWSITPSGGRLVIEAGDGLGSAIFSCPVTSSNFVGPGTGLTGTAAGLSVGGTAGSLSSMNISQFTNNSLYQYHRGDITSLSSSATNVVQPLGTFDGSNITNAPTSGWYNYLSSTHGSYLTSLIANLHRTSDWYVGYKEGPGGTPTNPSWYKLLHSGNYTDYPSTANAISFTEVELNAPATTGGTWTTGNGSQWGEPKFGTSFNQYRYSDADAANNPYVEYNVPANHHACFISQLQWDTGGYADCHGVQSDGDLVFLRRINTRQLVENSDHGNTIQHDGATVSFVGSGLGSFTKIRITNRGGRIHMTGIAFTRQIDDGYEGTGMVHPAQISHQGAGSGLNADLLDGYNPATANTTNTIVLRDTSGNFSAGTITATLSGTAATANALNTGNSYTVTALTATSEVGTRGTNIGANLERGDATVATLRFDSDNFRFYAGGTGGIGEILRVTEGGLVGIGTTVPSTLLHAYGSDGRYFTYSGTSGAFTIQRNAITTGGATPVLSLINTQGMDSSTGRGTSIQLDLGYGGSASVVGTAARGARIAALGETVYDSTAANQNAVLAFFTSTAGSLTEKLRIRSDGSLSPIAVSSTTAGATLLRTDGTNGTLFSVVDDLSDSLMSVNNSAGLPVLEVFADDRIVAGQYGQNDFVITNNRIGIGTNNPIGELHVSSSASIPSALFMGGNVGIGTTNPVYRFQVSGQTYLNNGTDNAILIQTNVADNTIRDGIVLYEDSSAATGKHSISWYNGNQSYFKARLWTEVGAGYLATQFGIDVADDARAVATRLLIRNGNVGIGTTLPRALLHVNGVISGSSFTGAGTGLTGTATGLSIGGSAASAATATNATQLGGFAAASYVTLTGTQTLLNKTLSGSLITVSNGQTITEYSGYIATPNDYPTCTEKARIYTVGTINDSAPYNSFIEIEVYGSHRGYDTTSYFEYKRWILLVGDKVSSNLVSCAGTSHYVGLWNGTDATGFNNTTAAGTVLRLVVLPRCGAGQEFVVKVRYANVNFTQGTFTYTNLASNPSVPTIGNQTINISGNAATANALTSMNISQFTNDSGYLTSVTIADGSITTAKLATDAVTTVKIADANVTAAKLATDSVTASKLPDGVITTVKITDANVTAAKLATDAVTTVKITDANVTAAKLATDSVTTVKIANSNVTLAKIENISTGRILGNNGASAAAPLALTSQQVAAMLSGQPMNIDGNCTGTAASLIAANSYTVGNLTVNSMAQLVGVKETYVDVNIASGVVTIDLNAGTVFRLNYNATVNSFTINNRTNNKVNSFTLISVAAAGAGGINFTFTANTLKWAGATAPTATVTAGKFDVFSFIFDGTNWYGFVGGLNY